MIKVIFFDGDGTLWYPHSTKRTRKPHWVYSDPSIKDPIREFVVTPGTVEALQELGRRNIKRVLLSTSPLALEEAIMHRIAILEHINIQHLLDHIEVAPNEVEGKRIKELLREYDMDEPEALQVGDSYLWDYVAATKVGVRAVLIRSAYRDEAASDLKRADLINDLRELLPICSI